MAPFLPVARLLAVAAFCSLTLTSCLDHDKKCDPKPSCGSTKTTTTTPIATPGT